MLPYWILFAVFALGALSERPYAHWQHPKRDMALFLAIALLAIMVGLRYNVGGDWGSYQRFFQTFDYMEVGRALGIGDIGYDALNLAVNRLGFGIWLVNLVCGVVFAAGLYRFALTQPSPWLTVLVAVPYLVIVVAMGYTRQGVAIGILLAGLARFTVNGSIVRFAIYVGIAAMFHRSAVVALPLVAFGEKRSFALNALVTGFAVIAMYDALVAPAMDRLVQNYVRTDLGSQGAAIRVAMCVIPAAFCLSVGDRLNFSPRERAIWRNFAMAAVVAMMALPFAPSTVIDRLSLYLLPLQLAVIPRLSMVIKSRSMGKAIVIAYAAAIQVTWLNFANYATFWLPYHFYPFA